MYVANSDQFSDYRTQLVEWDVYQAQVEEYGAMLGLRTDPKEFSAALKTSLAKMAAAVDAGMPENEHVDSDFNQAIQQLRQSMRTQEEMTPIRVTVDPSKVTRDPRQVKK
ncbi:hypothetical protein GTP44_23980 [Duganella sp. FT50W]|uniref:Uncharacterized protein n=1 Tax=Duganella lactea TaxID=2692173 RepID=A0A6L8MSF3_9BURK|nr:hypothetical protein [Duganella lactea]MYM84993.1 hypothetical protein [Duganella lactea]